MEIVYFAVLASAILVNVHCLNENPNFFTEMRKLHTIAYLCAYFPIQTLIFPEIPFCSHMSSIRSIWNTEWDFDYSVYEDDKVNWVQMRLQFMEDQFDYQRFDNLGKRVPKPDNNMPLFAHYSLLLIPS